MSRKRKLGELTRKERDILSKSDRKELENLKTISPGAWNRILEDVHGDLDGTKPIPDGTTLIYLDDAEIRKLKTSGVLKRDDVWLVYIKSKKR